MRVRPKGWPNLLFRFRSSITAITPNVRDRLYVSCGNPIPPTIYPNESNIVSVSVLKEPLVNIINHKAADAAGFARNEAKSDPIYEAGVVNPRLKKRLTFQQLVLNPIIITLFKDSVIM